MDGRKAAPHPLRVLLEKLYRIQEERYSELHGQKAAELIRRLGKKAYEIEEDDSFSDLDLHESVQSFLNNWIFAFAPRSVSKKALQKAIFRIIDLLHPPQFFEKDEDGSDYIARLAYETHIEDQLEEFLSDERDLDQETPKQSLSARQRQRWYDLAQVTTVITKVQTDSDLERFVIELLKIFKTQKFRDLMLDELPEIREVLA